MKLAGFNFNKMSGEKMSNNFEGLKIETKLDVKEIKEIKSNFIKESEELISISFYYGLEYNPNIAKLDFEGTIIVSIDSKEAKKILKDWKKKKMPDNFKIAIFNLILKKSNIKALQLEEDLILPTHISLPSLKIKEESK